MSAQCSIRIVDRVKRERKEVKTDIIVVIYHLL